MVTKRRNMLCLVPVVVSPGVLRRRTARHFPRQRETAEVTGSPGARRRVPAPRTQRKPDRAKAARGQVAQSPVGVEASQRRRGPAQAGWPQNGWGRKPTKRCRKQQYPSEAAASPRERSRAQLVATSSAHFRILECSALHGGALAAASVCRAAMHPGQTATAPRARFRGVASKGSGCWRLEAETTDPSGRDRGRTWRSRADTCTSET